MIEQAFPTSYSSHSNYFNKRVHDRDSDCRIIVPFHKLRTYVYGYWIVHYNYILLYHKVALTLTQFYHSFLPTLSRITQTGSIDFFKIYY